MRRVVAGVDDEGRSCVVEDVDLAPSSRGRVSTQHVVLETEVAPPLARPEGRGELWPMQLDPGLARFSLVDYGVGFDTPVPYHHTDTIDAGFVLSGSCELILDDGSHELRTGDTFVLMGIDHSWRIDPDGCRMCSVSIGTPPID
jgi:hypothetical protein